MISTLLVGLSSSYLTLWAVSTTLAWRVSYLYAIVVLVLATTDLILGWKAKHV